MNWLAAIGVGLSTGLAGAVVWFAVATAFVEWQRIPAREGIAGLVGMAIILLGIVGSVVLGIVYARYIGPSGPPSFLKAFGRSAAIVVGIGLALIALCWVLADRPPETEEHRLEPEEVKDTDTSFDALTVDDPIGAWLIYTRYGNPEPRIRQAAVAIRARPAFVADMTAEIFQADPRASNEALNAIAFFDPPPIELDAVVRRVARDITVLLRDFNAMPAGDASRRQEAESISAKFSAWMTAAEALQGKAGISYVDELQEIATLARASQDEVNIRLTVVRLASFYLQRWANIEPLPDDPPPR